MVLLDPTNAVPLYHQLKGLLKEEILSGRLRPHEKLPSERELLETYGVSRATVRQAIAELASEGLVLSRQGKGSFVAPPKLEQGLSRFYSFTENMRRLGRSPRSQVLELVKVPASARVAAQLGLAPETPVLSLTRLRLADEEPVMFETSFLPADLFPEMLTDDHAHVPLYTLMAEKYGIRPVKARESFEPILLRDYQAKILQAKPGSPALLLERVAFAANGRCVEFCTSVVRGDKCRFSVDLPEE